MDMNSKGRGEKSKDVKTLINGLWYIFKLDALKDINFISFKDF